MTLSISFLFFPLSSLLSTKSLRPSDHVPVPFAQSHQPYQSRYCAFSVPAIHHRPPPTPYRHSLVSPGEHASLPPSPHIEDTTSPVSYVERVPPQSTTMRKRLCRPATDSASSTIFVFSSHSYHCSSPLSTDQFCQSTSTSTSIQQGSPIHPKLSFLSTFLPLLPISLPQPRLYLPDHSSSVASSSIVLIFHQ